MKIASKKKSLWKVCTRMRVCICLCVCVFWMDFMCAYRFGLKKNIYTYLELKCTCRCDVMRAHQTSEKKKRTEAAEIHRAQMWMEIRDSMHLRVVNKLKNKFNALLVMLEMMMYFTVLWEDKQKKKLKSKSSNHRHLHRHYAEGINIS